MSTAARSDLRTQHLKVVSYDVESRGIAALRAGEQALLGSRQELVENLINDPVSGGHGRMIAVARHRRGNFRRGAPRA